MEAFGGILLVAFLLFIGSKAGYVTIKFHKPENKSSGGAGSNKTDEPPQHQQ